MSDFSEFEPSAWIEADGVCLVPVRVRVARAAKRLVRDMLPMMSTTTALAFCFASNVTSTAVASPSAESRSGFAISMPSSRRFASSGDGDVDPQVWGKTVARLRAMRPVEADRDFDGEPEPFI